MPKTNLVLVGLIAIVAVGCASAPQARPDQRALEAKADATITSFVARDPTMRAFLDGAPGYVVFPDVAAAGFVLGGEQGVGVVYENGRPIGYAVMRQANIGLQLGVQSYSQIVVFENREALQRLQAGNLDLAAQVTATAVQSGAAAGAGFEGGTAVFILDQSGLMAGATIGGEQIMFHAK